MAENEGRCIVIDPNATLKELRELASELVEFGADMGDTDYETKTARLAELVIVLDEWLSKGGFLPTAWAAGR